MRSSRSGQDASETPVKSDCYPTADRMHPSTRPDRQAGLAVRLWDSCRYPSSPEMLYGLRVSVDDGTHRDGFGPPSYVSARRPWSRPDWAEGQPPTRSNGALSDQIVRHWLRSGGPRAVLQSFRVRTTPT